MVVNSVERKRYYADNRKGFYMSYYEKHTKEVDEEIKRRFSVLEEQFGLMKNVAQDFFTDKKLNKSEDTPLCAALYWLNDEEKKIVKDFEQEYDAVVYHVVHSHTNLGSMYSLMYVSCHPEEWEDDYECTVQGWPYVAVNTPDYDVLDFGTICIAGNHGGIKRTY